MASRNKSNDPNDPWNQLQALVNSNMLAQQQYSNSMNPISYGSMSLGGSNNSPSGIQRGMRVVIMGGSGDDSTPENNPIWGHNGEYVAGVVNDMSRDGTVMLIMWDNGRRNQYRFGSADLRPLDQAPAAKKKPWGDKIELDTTKLDPLIIDPQVKAEVVALLQQHKHGKKIFEEWGLGEKIEYGRGMTIMFYGPPGTGKTFGAKSIAKALGKELLVIGAAEIQSSEPGGANRAIQQAFESASTENKVLFIDECDSLIANRAHLGMILASEINTLLTEIEKTEGVVILATNRISDMDAALERRLSLIIEFPMPNEEQRVAIWKGLIPSKMPLEDDVQIEILAKHVLSGGLIKNVVLQAARLAVSDDAKKVALCHFEKAIDRVKGSQGLMGKDGSWSQKGGDGMSVGTGTSKVKTAKKLSELLDKA